MSLPRQSSATPASDYERSSIIEPLFRDPLTGVLHSGVPDDVLLHILSFLDRTTLCSLQVVHSLFRPAVLASHDRIWQTRLDHFRCVFPRLHEASLLHEEEEGERSVFSRVAWVSREIGDTLRILRRCCVAPFFDEGLGVEDLIRKRKRLKKMEPIVVVVRSRIDRGGPLIRTRNTPVPPSLRVGVTSLMFVLYHLPISGYIPTCTDDMPVYTHTFVEFERTKVDLLFRDRLVNYYSERLQPAPDAGADVIVLCFDCSNPESFENMTRETEIALHISPHAVLVLCASKIDLRDEKGDETRFVRRGEALAFARSIPQVLFYVETSAHRGDVHCIAPVCAVAGLISRFGDRWPRVRGGKRCWVM